MQSTRKFAAITGASRGIGFAIAETLASEGFDLVVLARNTSRLESARDRLATQFPERSILHYACDLSDRQGIQGAAEFIRAHTERLDVLVNNAGSFVPGSVLTEEEGTLERMLDTNVLSAYYLTRGVIDLLRNTGRAHIINMCSIASLNAYKSGGAYGISKFALLGYSKNLREELKDENISVTAIMPGATWTDSWEGSGFDESRLMAASDIAEIVQCLLRLSPSAVMEEVIIRPQLGDL